MGGRGSTYNPVRPSQIKMSDKESRDIARKLQKTPSKNTPTKDKSKKKPGLEEAGAEALKPKSLFEEKGGEGKPLKAASPHGDPVYSLISMKNGQINRLDLTSLKRLCKEEYLDSSGKRVSVQKRLKEHFKNKVLREAGLLQPSPHRSFDYLIIVDFEATCEEKNEPDFNHEIIEFPAVLVDCRSGELVKKWREYVKPVLNPTLSEFCKTLTGISQETVDAAETFPLVLQHFEYWLRENSLGIDSTFALVTDGPFDVGRFLRLSCQHDNIPLPVWGSRWCNVRKAFANFYRSNTATTPGIKVCGLQKMLERLGLEFEGTPHSGIDDATNIARVASRIIKDGGILRVNERLEENLENVSPARLEKNFRLPHVVPVTRKEAESWLRERRDLLEV